MSALEKLKMYLNRLNRVGVPKHIDQYVQFCMNFYSENALSEMTPEQIEGGRFCLPEHEVRYSPSNQWEMTRQKESNEDTEARKIGELEEEANQVSSKSENRKSKEDKDGFAGYESDDESNASMTPASNVTNQSGLTKGYIQNKHTDKYEEDLEVKNAEDTNNNLRVVKQKKKSNFRIARLRIQLTTRLMMYLVHQMMKK